MNNKQILFFVLFVFVQNVSRVYSSEYKTDDNDINITNIDNNFITADSDEQSTTGNPNYSSKPGSSGINYEDIFQKGKELIEDHYNTPYDTSDRSGNNIPDHTPVEDYNKDETLDETPEEYRNDILDQTSDEDEDEILYDDEDYILDNNPITFFLCNTCHISGICCNPWSFIFYHLCCKTSQNIPGTTKKPAITKTTTTTQKATTKQVTKTIQETTTQNSTTEESTTQTATTNLDTKTTQNLTTKEDTKTSSNSTTKQDIKTQEATTQTATTNLDTKTTPNPTTKEDKKTSPNSTTKQEIKTTQIPSTTSQNATTKQDTKITQNTSTTTKPK